MLAWTHPACLEHDPGPEHPERPARLRAVLDALYRAYPGQAWREAPLALRGDLLRVHAASLVDEVLAPLAGERRRLDPDTVVSAGSTGGPTFPSREIVPPSGPATAKASSTEPW